MYHSERSPVPEGIEPHCETFDIARYQTYGAALRSALYMSSAYEKTLILEHDKHIPLSTLSDPEDLFYGYVKPFHYREIKTTPKIAVLPYLIYPNRTGLDRPYIVHHIREDGKWLWLDESDVWLSGIKAAVRVNSIGIGVVAWPPDAWEWIDPAWDYPDLDSRFSEMFVAMGGEMWCLRPWAYHWHWKELS